MFSLTDMKVTMATCCDADGFCYGDGSDAWCCNNSFYCTNDNPIRAAERGGILCPKNEAMVAHKILNTIGLVISGLLILLACFFYWYKANPKAKLVDITIEDEEDKPTLTEMTNESNRKTPSDLKKERRKTKLLDAKSK